MNARRSFILGIAALVIVAQARAQRTTQVRRIGVLVNGSEQAQGARFEVFRRALRALGYSEGREVIFDIRWNDATLEALDARAAEMVRARPDVILAWPVYSARAAHQHTRTVPIVIAGGAGALEWGLAASLARPGGNVTGMISRGEDLVGKRFELLRAIAPRISRVALIYSGQQLVHDAYMQAARAGAKSVKLTLIEQKVTAAEAVAPLAGPLQAAGCEGIVVAWDALTSNLRPQLIELAALLRVPAVYPLGEFAKEGGLASYDASMTEVFARAADYVDRILKGAAPGELPIQLPTKFEFAINLKTAKALGITIPQSVLVRADRVIE